MNAARRARHRGAWPAVLAFVVAAACGGSDDTPAAPTTSATATTAAPATTRPATSTSTETSTSTATTIRPSTTTGGPATTSSTAAPVTSCTERAPARPLAVDGALEAALATFRPLARTPAVVLDVQPPELPAPEAATVSVDRIPGGLLVLSRLGSVLVDPMPATPTTVTALDWDGTVRWVRCLAAPGTSVLVAEAADGPDLALVVTTVWEGGTLRTTWTGLSLADGRDAPEVADRFGALEDGGISLRAGMLTGRWLLLEPEVPEAGRSYGVVDLATMTVRTVAAPPVDDPARTWLGVTAEGAVVAYAASPDGAVLAHWRDGRWTTGAGGAGIGVRVAFVTDGADPRGQLRGIDAAGRVRWSVADRYDPQLQGVGTYVDGDTAVTQTCEPVGDSDCTFRLTAVDLATGAVRWELPGLRLVAGTPADGLALVSEGDVGTGAQAWLLVDTATGAAVDGQRWNDPTAFSRPCCGDSEYDSTLRHGAVVVVVDNRSVRVWLPADVALPGWTRRLP